jgi:hypothetical protein
MFVKSFFLNRTLLPCGVEGFFYLLIYRQLVGLLRRVIGPTQGLYLHTGQHNGEKRRHTSMPRVGFEPAISTFERPKTVLASDRSDIETGMFVKYRIQIPNDRCAVFGKTSLLSQFERSVLTEFHYILQEDSY